MKKIINKISADTFLKNNFIFFIGSMIVAVLNYLYYPVLARLLSVENFGEAQTINTLVLQSMVILSALGYVAIHLFSNTGDEKKATEKVKSLEGSAFLVSLFALFLVLFFQEKIISYFKFSSFFSLLSIGIIFLINIPLTIKRAWLQTREDFISISVVGALVAVGKIAFAGVLIILGYQISGVIAGLLVATIFSLLFVNYKSKTGIRFRKHFSTNYFKKIVSDAELREDLYYGAMIFIVLITITIFYSADVLFIRRYFSTTISGLYAGVSAIANTIFFATLAFSNVMLPAIKIGDSKVNKSNFYIAFTVTIFTGGIILFLFYLLPNFFIGLLVGEKYLEFSSLLPKISFFIFLSSVSNIVLMYLIALKKKAAPVISIIGVVFLYFLVNINHGDVTGIIQDFIYANVLVLALSLVYIIFHFRETLISE